MATFERPGAEYERLFHSLMDGKSGAQHNDKASSPFETHPILRQVSKFRRIAKGFVDVATRMEDMFMTQLSSAVDKYEAHESKAQATPDVTASAEEMAKMAVIPPATYDDEYLDRAARVYITKIRMSYESKGGLCGPDRELVRQCAELRNAHRAFQAWEAEQYSSMPESGQRGTWRSKHVLSWKATEENGDVHQVECPVSFTTAPKMVTSQSEWAKALVAEGMFKSKKDVDAFRKKHGTVVRRVTGKGVPSTVLDVLGVPKRLRGIVEVKPLRKTTSKPTSKTKPASKTKPEPKIVTVKKEPVSAPVSAPMPVPMPALLHSPKKRKRPASMSVFEDEGGDGCGGFESGRPGAKREPGSPMKPSVAKVARVKSRTQSM